MLVAIIFFGILQDQIGQIKPYFEHLRISDGLSQSTVTSICQDSLGYMWFATQDGLNRYDGKHFKTFRKSREDSNSLSSNEIRFLMAGHNGNLWIATHEGLNYYDIKTNQFRFLMLPKDSISKGRNQINGMIEDNNHRIWLISNNGIFIIREDLSLVKRFHEQDNQSNLADNVVNLIAKNNSGRIIVSTIKGVQIFNANKNQFESFYNLNFPITAFYEDAYQNIWLGTVGRGILRIHAADLKLSSLDTEIKALNSSENVFTAILEIKERLLLAATENNGIYLIDYNQDRFLHIKKDDKNPRGLTDDKILSAYKEKNGIVFLGSFNDGLQIYQPFKSQFQYLSFHDKSNLLPPSIIWALAYQDNKLWIGSDEKGLHLIDINMNQAYSHKDLDPESNIPTNGIFAIELDDNDIVWIGTANKGIFKYNSRTKKTEQIHYKNNYVKLGMRYLHRIKKDNHGNLWIASLYGLFKYHIKSKQFSHFLPVSEKKYPYNLNSINDLVIDTLNDHIWLASEYNGIFRFTVKDSSWINIDTENSVCKISNNTVVSLAIDNKNHLWAGTIHGLNVIDMTSLNVKIYDESTGMINSNIYGIVVDYKNQVWVSTNYGLCRFSFNRDLDYRIKNYNINSGLINNEYNQFSFTQNAEKNRLFFGGIDGIDFIDVDNFSDYSFPPLLVIEQIKIADRIILFPRNGDFIQLSAYENQMEIFFTDVNLFGNINNSYFVKLSPFDKNWVSTENRTFMRYTNLSGGSYELQLKATNSEGYNSYSEAYLRIVVDDPFYLSPWFAITAIFLIYLIIYLIIKLRIQRYLKIAKLLEDKVRERSALIIKRNKLLLEANEEIGRQKMELEEAFTEIKRIQSHKEGMIEMIAHDLKHPLNTILTLTHLPVNDKDLKLIHQSGNQILNMIMNLLETQKYEHESMQLEKQSYSLKRIIHSALEPMKILADQKHIQVDIHVADDVFVFCDYELIERVIINLLSNSIKYTRADGLISINAHYFDDNFYLISIRDNGQGIPQDKIQFIFEKYAKLDERKSGSIRSSGLGLTFCKLAVEAHQGKIWVESIVNKETTFSFTLSKSHKVDEALIVYNQSHSETIRFNIKEKHKILSLCQDLKETDFYEASEIVLILDKIKQIDNDTHLHEWCDSLENAVFNNNESHYNELLNELETHVSNTGSR